MLALLNCDDEACIEFEEACNLLRKISKLHPSSRCIEYLILIFD